MEHTFFIYLVTRNFLTLIHTTRIK